MQNAPESQAGGSAGFGDSLNLVYMKLGDFDFTLDSAMYQRIEEQVSAVWTSHQSLKGALPHHSSGPGKRRMTLPGSVHRDQFGTLDALDQLRDMATTPEPWPLISSGAVQNLGYWVIVALSLRHEQIDMDGLGRHIRFSLILEYYGDRLA